MSTHNIGFYEDLKKKKSFNYHQISSNTHLISYPALGKAKITGFVTKRLNSNM